VSGGNVKAAVAVDAAQQSRFRTIEVASISFGSPNPCKPAPARGRWSAPWPSWELRVWMRERNRHVALWRAVKPGPGFHREPLQQYLESKGLVKFEPAGAR
jgi:hypothetical protein